MAESRAIRRLIRSFEAIKNQSQIFDENTHLVEIKTCIALLADDWREFRNFEQSLKVVDDTLTEAMGKIESIHTELRLKLFRLEKLHEEEQIDYGDTNMSDLLANQTSFLQQVTNLNNKESEVRLPRVNIPAFSGNYSEFPSFCDLFETSIHNNAKISKVYKLQYLKGLLKGEAYTLISHITVTEAHYDEAWDKVKSRYNKQKHVVNTLLKQFMAQPGLQQNNAKSLRYLTDTSDEVIRGLKALGQQAEARDPWLIYILMSKLDDDSKEAWAHETAEIDFPSLEQLFKFLNKRSDALESLNSILKQKVTPSKRVSAMTTQFNKAGCPLCLGDHYIAKCDQFLKLPIPERKQLTVEKKLCFNCLSSTHQSIVCKSRYNCRLCKRRHHITLHPESEDKDNKDIIVENMESTNKSEMASYNTIMSQTTSNSNQLQAILPTAMVFIKDRNGNNQRCRILLDSGSQSSFISERCVQRLQLSREKANITITGITANAVKSRGRTSLVMVSIHEPTSQIEVTPLIINRLPTNIPSCNFDVRDNRILVNYTLADSDFQIKAPIDVIIGADKFFNILQNGRKQFNSIILQQTIFGWVISGQPKSISNTDSSNFMALNVQLDTDVDRTLRKFWEIEEIPQTSKKSPQDIECEEFYNRTFKRQQDGRYIVQLPFKKLNTRLGDSYTVATHRFMSLERKLTRDKKLREEYIKIMREYLEMGHMVEIHPNQYECNEVENYYLPHHSVLKESSKTTRIRIVFDGSSMSTTGVSLNNKLMVGSTIQPTLWATLMRFRSNRIAITADIEKMYRQVVVSDNDRRFQRVLWRENPGQRLRQYELTRVTFGLACSAFLAIRTLQQLAHDEGDEIIRKHIAEDFYVDDFLSGAPDIKGATKLKETITRVLNKGGFPLRKWRSNHQSLNEASDATMSELCSDYTLEVTILGLHWHPNTDILTYQVKPEQEGKVTKRKVISETSRVFDPLGFLSPSIILLKILFQRLWLEKLDWDDELPERYKEEYQRVRREFKYFQNLEIPRFTDYGGNVQIHGFADASEVAYCAVVYSRITDENGKIITHLLASKTKVAPLKKVSLPRLELCAADLLAKLLKAVTETIAPTASCYAWTDSTIVLAWLAACPSRWKTFVSNRVSQILEKYPRQFWSHVKSADNPADLGTRGLIPSKLIKTHQWWNGPEWLKQPEEHWLKTYAVPERVFDTAISRELRKGQTATQVFQAIVKGDLFEIIFENKSSIIKIFRVVAYVKRFVKNSKTKNQADRDTNELTASEITNAKIDCIRWVQVNEYSEDIKYLQHNKTIKLSSKLISLAPFIDKSGILRVGGRLSNADCDYDVKHPILLPANHAFTERLIRETHYKNLHAGPTLTNNLIRQNYWIINGRAKIRSLLRNCVTCAKYAQKTSSQLMGNLPIERITPTRPFKNCGIDFAGPLYFATKRGRGGTKPVKGYLCIFVCMSIKAVHIEPVSDLTSLAFLAALKRFASRRGVPENIYTDNGSNFIGARRILLDAYNMIKRINKDYIISEYLSQNHINWHFIPPSSPHFGGLWESAVKSVKTHLLKSTKNVNLTFEEMATLLCQIESILNSRPLCTTSAGDDYEALTPAHFLIGSSIESIPEKQIAISTSYSSRWHRIQARIQMFWKKYYVDYVNNLQQRYKWQRDNNELQIGDIVLLKEDDIPVAKWLLGRIIQIHPGNDDLVRVVTIKTAKTILKRPIVKVCRLPVG